MGGEIALEIGPPSNCLNNRIHFNPLNRLGDFSLQSPSFTLSRTEVSLIKTVLDHFLLLTPKGPRPDKYVAGDGAPPHN
jgi:hypothetical protein